MRYVFSILALLMILAVLVQYNDPDGPLWMVYYGVPAIWCGLAAFRPGVFAKGAARTLLAVSVVAAVALTIWYWPTASGFWHEQVWRMGMIDPQSAQIAEQSREGMGMMIAAVVMIVVAAWSLLRRADASPSSRLTT